MGNITFNIKILTNKINDLDKATIDIKALSPQLKKIIDNQNNLDTEIDLLQSLILKKSKNLGETDNENIERNVEATDKKKIIIDNINEIKLRIENLKDPDVLISDLNDLKEKIFEYTGGHKILYEISKIIKKIEKEREITSEIRDMITEKSIFWKNKL
ncbi:MAG: hypothetical protein KGD57_09520 [Candidatus Lokiarchaeota archaeon]|nr:hypothetical protein [Candidatus Lokiarchaeota archaeon]